MHPITQTTLCNVDSDTEISVELSTLAQHSPIFELDHHDFDSHPLCIEQWRTESLCRAMCSASICRVGAGWRLYVDSRCCRHHRHHTLHASQRQHEAVASVCRTQRTTGRSIITKQRWAVWPTASWSSRPDGRVSRTFVCSLQYTLFYRWGSVSCRQAMIATFINFSFISSTMDALSILSR